MPAGPFACLMFGAGERRDDAAAVGQPRASRYERTRDVPCQAVLHVGG